MSVDVTLLRPLWLLGVPLVALLGWMLWSRRGGLGDWDRVADAGLMRAMGALGLVEARASRVPFLSGLAVLALICVALAGPAVERRDSLSWRNLDGVLLVVDASRSVTEGPRWPEMLTMGRFAVSSLGTRPGGIIVYAGDAYPVAEMTLDHLELGQSFSLIGPDLVPDPGSRPERALDLAARMLEGAEVIAGDVILFTDGAGLGPQSVQAAEKIAGQGARLSVVTSDETPMTETHARVSGGRVFALDQVEDLAAWIGEDARSRLEQQDHPLLFWTDLGRFVLIAALVPLLLLFRRERA